MLVLFEEPETFLHPAQQNILYSDLVKLAKTDNQQVIVSTHSTHFVSKSVDDLPSICRLTKTDVETKFYQVTSSEFDEIIKANQQKIFDHRIQSFDDNRYLYESMRYMVWLDSERASLFFARHVIICEERQKKFT